MGLKVHTQITMLLISLLLINTLPSSVSEPPSSPPDYYSDCSKPYECGGLKISYPLWGDNRPKYCGSVPFELLCETETDDGSGQPRYYTSIKMGSQYFNVVDIIINPQNYSMELVPLEGPNGEPGVCAPDFEFSLSTPLLMYNESVHNITLLYNCNTKGVSVYKMGCPDDYDGYGNSVVYYNNTEDELLKQHSQLKSCHHVQLPAEAVFVHHDGLIDYPPYFGQGFAVNYSISKDCVNCMRNRGLCGSNHIDVNQFACYYPPKRNRQKWIVVGIVAASVVGVLVLAIVAFLFYRRKKKTSYGMSYTQPRSMSSDPSSWKDTEKGSQYFGAHLFSYTELEEATNFFDPSRELGDGGFGTVYYGQLPDGRCIAVKRLYENNYRRVEQFMNEIEILTRLRHKNLVSLFGCTSRHSRELLLVYEYIANGTVADHLHGNRAKAGTLPWHIRMNIALETATALAYLHESEIIHRDVKTNNILLDSHFVVKVADFGLSRLFPNNVTHVSTVPQGTPGYVDPEYHECYQLTVKSDVYSFGVVLVELISSLPAVDITRHRHEINLANMAINKIQNQTLHELVDKNLGFDSDLKVRKMINAVAELAFQCLQSSKDLRPSMQEVVDTLKDIQSDGEYKSQSHAEVMDISSTADDAVLLKDDPPPPSPASTVASKSTTPNASG